MVEGFPLLRLVAWLSSWKNFPCLIVIRVPMGGEIAASPMSAGGRF
jgi:hypothetical protein